MSTFYTFRHELNNVASLEHEFGGIEHILAFFEAFETTIKIPCVCHYAYATMCVSYMHNHVVM